MSRPLVSVGLPVHNGEPFLEAALTSWRAQTFTNFELLISDNASTDATEEIGRTFAALDDRIAYTRNRRNIGAAANFNQVFHRARGTFFKWAPHDDYVAPAFLERCVEAFASHPESVVVHSPPVLVDDEGRRLAFHADQRAFVDRHGKAWFVRPGTERELASPDPLDRFRAILNIHSIYCFELLGLIRRDALIGSRLIANYYGSDRVLLAELTLKGPFATPGPELMFRRCHPAQSTHSLTPSEQTAWISGRAVRTIMPPQGRLFLDYLRVARDAPLPLGQRTAVLAAVLQRAFLPEKLRRLFLPGEDNYFGLGRAARPASTT